MSALSHIGIRLNADPRVLLQGSGGIVAQVGAATWSVWRRASELPLRDGFVGARLRGSPTFAWSGASAGDVPPRQRLAIERQLRDAIESIIRAHEEQSDAWPEADLWPRVEPLRSPAARSWMFHDVEFETLLGPLLELMTDAAVETKSRAASVRFAQSNAPAAAESIFPVATVVDITRECTWSSLHSSLMSHARSRFGPGTLSFCLWDEALQRRLVALDRRHLATSALTASARSTPAKPPQVPGSATLPIGSRLVLVAFRLPQLTLEDFVRLEPAVTVSIPLAELLDTGLVDGEVLARTFRVDVAAVNVLQRDWSRFPVDVAIVPFATTRSVSPATLRSWLDDRLSKDAGFGLDGHRPAVFARMQALAQAPSSRLPNALSEALSSLAGRSSDVGPQGLGLAGRAGADQTPEWPPGTRGAYVLPRIDGQMQRLLQLPLGRQTVARDWVQQVLRWGAASEINGRRRALEQLLSNFGEDDEWLFGEFLDELDRRGALAVFFQTVDATRQVGLWLLNDLALKVAHLSRRSRHADHPALRALVLALPSALMRGIAHTFDLAGQRVHLGGHSDSVLFASRACLPGLSNVVSEVSGGVYSQVSSVYSLSDSAMARLSKPLKAELGRLVTGLICRADETASERELFTLALEAAMHKASPPLEKEDFTEQRVRASLQLLALEEHVISGVRQLRLRVQPVTQIEDRGWQPSGPEKLLTPQEFDSELTRWRTQHLISLATLMLTAEMVIGAGVLFVAVNASVMGALAAARVAGGAAATEAVTTAAAVASSVKQLILMVSISELMLLWQMRGKRISLQDVLEAALLAELQAIVAAGVASTAVPVLGLAASGINGTMIRAAGASWLARVLFNATGNAAGAVTDLFLRDLLHMTRCKGMSSRGDYFRQAGLGFCLSIAIELGAPAIAATVGSGLAGARTLLQAIHSLRKAKVPPAQLELALAQGAERLAEGLNKVALDPGVKAELVEEARSWSQRVVQQYRKQIQEAGIELEQLARARLLRRAGGAATDVTDALAARIAATHQRLIARLQRGGWRRVGAAGASKVKPPLDCVFAEAANDLEALAAYELALESAPGREVGLFFDPDTGAYRVIVGDEVSLPAQHVLGWEGVAHYHPDAATRHRLRLPAPQDFVAMEQWAAGSERAREFIDFDVPGQGAGRTEFGFDAAEDLPYYIVTHLPGATGVPQRFASLEDFAVYWNGETIYVAPGLPLYKAMGPQGLSAEVGRTAAGVRANSAPLLDNEGVPTEAGLAWIRSKFAQKHSTLADMSDADVRQEFFRRPAWLEAAAVEELKASWKGRSSAVDFLIVKAKLSVVAERLHRAVRRGGTGHVVNDGVLGKNAMEFIQEKVCAGDPGLAPAWRALMIEAERSPPFRLSLQRFLLGKQWPQGVSAELRDLAMTEQGLLNNAAFLAGSAEGRVATARADRGFAQGEVGRKELDALEVALSRDELHVVDPSQQWGQLIHNFKSAFYDAVLRDLINVKATSSIDYGGGFRISPAGGAPLPGSAR